MLNGKGKHAEGNSTDENRTRQMQENAEANARTTIDSEAKCRFPRTESELDPTSDCRRNRSIPASLPLESLQEPDIYIYLLLVLEDTLLTSFFSFREHYNIYQLYVKTMA